jgi:putative heme-binding domain-containing protein
LETGPNAVRIRQAQLGGGEIVITHFTISNYRSIGEAVEYELSHWRLILTRIILTIAVATAIAPYGLAQTKSEYVTASRPVAVWPSGPLDVVAAFDKTVGLSTATSLVGKSIPYFDPAGTANDRTAAPRPLGSLRIVGARLTDAGRTLTLATDPHPRLARYVVPLSATWGNPPINRSAAGETSYDLSGVEVAWSDEGSPDAQPRWTGWWPSLDLKAIRRLTRGSKRHEDGLAILAKPGRLVLSALVRLPKGNVTVYIESSQPIEEAIVGDVQAELTATTTPAETYRTLLKMRVAGDPLFLSITCRTAANNRPFSLRASYRSGEDKTDRPLERDQLIVPWAPLPSTAATAPLVVPDLAGGDAARGRTIFNGEQARCAQCHAIKGQGGKVGPDLTDIGKKGGADLYRAIAAPSAAIDPEFTSYSVATRNGQVVVGVVRADGPDAIRVTDTNAHTVVISRLEIEQIRPSANSIMPVGLTGALGDAAVRDLIAFLTDRAVSTR